MNYKDILYSEKIHLDYFPTTASEVYEQIIDKYDREDFVNVPADAAYRSYVAMCKEYGYRPSSKYTFAKVINTCFGLRTKVVRVGENVFKCYMLTENK